MDQTQPLPDPVDQGTDRPPPQPTLTMPIEAGPKAPPPPTTPKAANLAMKVQARKLTGPMSGGI